MRLRSIEPSRRDRDAGVAPSPWSPPGLGQFAALGLRFNTPGGALEQDRVMWSPCYRVIACEYSGENLFDRLTDGVAYKKLRAEVDALREIADLTNTYVRHEAGQFDLVRPDDRIYGSGAGLIMAAFAFPGRPSRFSDGSAGTYYAAEALETAVAETRFHEEATLRGSGPCVTEKTVIHAELDATLVDLRRGHACPVGVYDVDDYGAGQAFGSMVRHLDGYGIVYDAVRHPGGECVAIFRPSVLHAAKAVQTLGYHWDGRQVFAVR